MGQPSSSLATLRPELAASLEEFDLEADRQNFVAHQIAPTFRVGIRSGTFGRIPLEQLLQNAETARAPGSGYSRGNFKFAPDSYACEEHGHEEPVDDVESEIYEEFFDAEVVATQRAKDVVLRNAEKRWADTLFNAATWTGSALTTALVNEWDDLVNADPIADIEAAVRKVWENSGLWPNTLIINRHVFRNLRRCEKLLENMLQQNFVDVRPSKITTDVLASVFDLDRVIVAGGTKNLSAEGQAFSAGKIWSDEYAMVCRTAVTNDVKEPCIARTFWWPDHGAGVDGRIESYRDESIRGDVIRFRHQVDEKVMYVEMGHLLSNVTT